MRVNDAHDIGIVVTDEDNRPVTPVADGGYDTTNRLVLREMLSGWGLESRDFETAIDALDDLANARQEQRPYSLAIVDNQMPGIDGFEAARRIHAVAPDLPVVMLASDTERGDESRRLDAGVSGFAVKPIDRAALLRVIAGAMGGAVARDASGDGAPARPDVQPLAILVAEDFPDNRVLVQAYLKELPYDVVFAEDGNRVIDLFKQRHFDMVLMDIQMPGVDGLDATRAIRRFERQQRRVPTPVIALTANARPSDVEAARAAGCDDYLAKPISKRALVSAIQRFTATPVAPADRLAPIAVDVPEALAELAAEYLDARRTEADDLQLLVAADDFERLRVVAHNIAGSGSSYGFARLTEIGRELEEAARAHDRVTAEREVAALRDYVARVRITGGRPA
jgi:CheY-like chemotaxis protein